MDSDLQQIELCTFENAKDIYFYVVFGAYAVFLFRERTEALIFLRHSDLRSFRRMNCFEGLLVRDAFHP